MTSFGRDLLLLIFGWLFGLASPIIVDHLKRRRDEREFRDALKTELDELQYRMAVVVFTIQTRLGFSTRKTLNWLRPIVANYEGINRSEMLIANIDSMLKLTDQQINLLEQATKPAEGRTIALKKYSAPLLDAKIASLSAFDTDSLRRLLEVQTNLALFNDEVEQCRFFFQLTFTSTSDVNHPRAVQGLEEAQKNAASRAQVVVEHIGKIRWPA